MREGAPAETKARMRPVFRGLIDLSGLIEGLITGEVGRPPAVADLRYLNRLGLEPLRGSDRAI